MKSGYLWWEWCKCHPRNSRRCHLSISLISEYSHTQTTPHQQIPLILCHFSSFLQPICTPILPHFHGIYSSRNHRSHFYCSTNYKSSGIKYAIAGSLFCHFKCWFYFGISSKTIQSYILVIFQQIAYNIQIQLKVTFASQIEILLTWKE